MEHLIPKPIVMPPGSGRVLRLVGVTHKLTSQQTGSDYYLFESEFDPESGNRLHALYNPRKEPLRILVLAIPGGMEQFFDELESTMLGGTMDDGKHREISQRYGIEWLE